MNGLVVYVLMLAIGVGVWKKVRIYSCFVTGAEEGLRMAAGILPPLLTMMLAIGALRTSGITDALSNVLAPVLEKWGFPKAVLPLMLLRPLSGSASLAMVEELMTLYGPDSREALMGCTLCASSETLFYVLPVYLGASGIRKSRHIIPSGLISWLVGSFVSVWIWRFF